MSRVISSIRKAFSKSGESKDPKQGSDGKASNGQDPDRSGLTSPTGTGAAKKDRENKVLNTKAPVPRKPSLSMPPDQPRITRDDLLKPLPSFQSVPQNERAALFIKKLHLCSVLFVWEPVEDANAPIVTNQQDPDDTRAKELKRQILLELVDFVSKTKNFIDEHILSETMQMVSINLFRTIQSVEKTDDPEEEETIYEPAWPHLQIVYEFFLRFIVSSDLDSKLLKQHINNNFILNLLELFDSEDPRERDYLKTILHRIYAKFTSLRAFVRKAINNTFWTVIYETDRHNGAAELLEILGSIINGFALPLKEEHKTFLRRVLIPLHKVKRLAPFHQQLSYCIMQFINKEPELSVVVIDGLLKLWPITNSAKEVVFLNELEEILELTRPEEFRKFAPRLFKQLSRAIGSPHFQVAERALFLWQNEHISNLIADERVVIFPIIFPKHHWNPTVHNLSGNVLKIFVDIDAQLVQDCTQKLQQDQPEENLRSKQREEMWKRITEETQRVTAARS